MIRSELVTRLLAQNPRLYHKDCEAVVHAIFDRISDALAAGDRVEIRGFGSFTVQKHPARMGCNPRSGAVVSVEAKGRLHFKAGKDMRDRLNLVSALAATSARWNRQFDVVGKIDARSE